MGATGTSKILGNICIVTKRQTPGSGDHDDTDSMTNQADTSLSAENKNSI
jgi:hypothetical protein